MIIEIIESHAKTLLAGFIERKETFTINLLQTAPEGLDVVGWGIFIKSDNLHARLRYIYKDRAKALAKLDSLLPNTSITVSLDQERLHAPD